MDDEDRFYMAQLERSVREDQRGSSWALIAFVLLALLGAVVGAVRFHWEPSPFVRELR